MKITLKHYTPLYLCSDAIRKCWDSSDKSDTYRLEGQDVFEVIIGDNDKALINRVGNKNKHSSTLEHLVYHFDIVGISRAVLQELARHRVGISLSVKSSRYTLNELKKEKTFCPHSMVLAEEGMKRASRYVVFTKNDLVNKAIINSLEYLRQSISQCISNDTAKYCMPEAYKTELAWTINARSLQNFLELRTNKAALWEIRDLANAIFQALPQDHKYLFEHCIYEEKQD